MTGLKSGSGDDLWGDDSADESEENARTDSESNKTESVADEERTNGTETRSSDSLSGGVHSRSTRQGQPYIVRRAIQDKSVQFERDERLTFFVHNDVIEGERELLREAETAFGRDVPKFDVREAVYRAALQNQDDVLNELIEMGYSPSTE